MSTLSQTTFFGNPGNLDALRVFSRTLRSYAATLENNQIPNSLLQIVDWMISNTAAFDEYCTINIEWIGEHFMREVREFPDLALERRSEAVNAAFASAFRFLCELEFTQPAEPSFEVRRIANFVDQNLETFTGTDRQQIMFARYSMPVQIAKKLLNNPGISDFRKFSEFVEAAKKLKTDWDSDLNQRKMHVDSLKEELKGATSSYNFVGLVDGFRHLTRSKLSEQKVAFWSLIALALVMVMPPSAQIGYVISHIDIIELKKTVLVYTLPAIIAVEVILIYLFRVVLSQFRSVKAQVLQLDLRVALCQFVESYAVYSAKVKKDDPDALSKFEAVVFSSLVSESDSIPSTFDGAEQLTNLIKSIRGT